MFYDATVGARAATNIYIRYTQVPGANPKFKVRRGASISRGSQGFKAGPEHSPSEGPGGEAFGSSLTLVDFSIFKTCSNSTKTLCLAKI